MDNLTHSLVGVLAGETATRFAPGRATDLPAAQRRNLAVTLMAVGSNLPDLDFLYYAFTGDKLDYLLHHRGHTHTILAALAIAALMFAACLAWLRWRRHTLPAADLYWIAGIALLAPLLHIAMDYMNNYGVHPFWPFFNGWLYGDSVFIIEPLIWVATTPLLFTLRTRIARAVVVIALLAAIALSFFPGFVPVPFAIALTILTALMVLLGRRATPQVALLGGVALWLGTTAMFTVASSAAAARLDRLVAKQFEQATTLDRVLTPLPVNPLCWDVILLQTQADDYSIRLATLSLAPALLPASKCPKPGIRATSTAPLLPSHGPGSAAIQWHSSMRMPRREIAALAMNDCRAAAFMQFARAPYVWHRDGERVLGDIRYDREPELGFAEFALEESKECPQPLPAWLPPRADLLRQE